jgi:hypothetical protein
MGEIGKLLVMAGLALVVVGGLLWLTGGRLPTRFLPGDIAYEKGGMRFYFPIVTCLALSLLLTLIAWLFRK